MAYTFWFAALGTAAALKELKGLFAYSEVEESAEPKPKHPKCTRTVVKKEDAIKKEE